MKKMVILFALLLFAVPASGEVFTFGDTHNYWPTWQNGSGDDSRDVIGLPNFTRGTVTVEGGYIKNISFSGTGFSQLPNKVNIGDLFIGMGNDTNWDYVVKTYNQDGAGERGIYAVSTSMEKPNGDYILSGVDNLGYWSGYSIRDNHPIAFNGSGTSGGSLYFGGYGNSDSLITYDFTNSGSSSGLLVSGGSFFIGQTVNCANDVIFEQVSVPEPQTLLMLGFGLVGLLGLTRRKIA